MKLNYKLFNTHKKLGQTCTQYNSQKPEMVLATKGYIKWVVLKEGPHDTIFMSSQGVDDQMLHFRCSEDTSLHVLRTNRKHPENKYIHLGRAKKTYVEWIILFQIL